MFDFVNNRKQLHYKSDLLLVNTVHGKRLHITQADKIYNLHSLDAHFPQYIVCRLEMAQFLINIIAATKFSTFSNYSHNR